MGRTNAIAQQAPTKDRHARGGKGLKRFGSPFDELMSRMQVFKILHV